MANQLRYSFDELPDYIKNAPAFKKVVVEKPIIEEESVIEPMPKIEKVSNPIFNYIKKHGLTDLDENDFLKNYSTKEGAKEIYNYMTSTKDGDGNPLTGLKFDDFYNKYLNQNASDVKKKDFVATGIGSENLSQGLENMEYLGDEEGPGKKKKKTSQSNLGFVDASGKPLANKEVKNLLSTISKAQKVTSDAEETRGFQDYFNQQKKQKEQEQYNKLFPQINRDRKSNV
jgi:hypothetical protein